METQRRPSSGKTPGKTPGKPAPTGTVAPTPPPSVLKEAGLTPEEIQAALEDIDTEPEEDDDGADEVAALAAALKKPQAGTPAPETPAQAAPASKPAASAPSSFVDMRIETHNGELVTDNVDKKSARRLIITALKTPGTEHFQTKDGAAVIVTPRAVLRFYDEVLIAAYLEQSSATRVPGVSAP